MTRQNILAFGLIYPGAALVLLAVFVMMLRRSVSSGWLRVAAGLGVVLSVLRIYFVSLLPSWGFDYTIFANIGRDIWVGLDPYDPARFWHHPFLNPPSTFPLFVALGVLPHRMGLVVWTIVNTALALLMVPLAHRVVRAQSGLGPWSDLQSMELGALAAAFALSDACTALIDLGQLSLLASLLILVALDIQRQQPVLAGVCLALATMKIGTMLPFLLLFVRREDRATWVSLILAIPALCLVGGHPERLIGQCQNLLRYIGKLSQPGGVNDLTYAGPNNEWIIGFDHALYRVGIHDPKMLQLSQFIILLALGAWLAWGIWTNSLPRGLAVANVSLFSVLFLYHRLYDAVMFAPSLVYAVGRAKSCRSRSRYYHIATAMLVLSVLYMRRRPLAMLTALAPSWGLLGQLIQAVILPYATWATLLAMLCLWLADARRPRKAPRPGAGAAPTLRQRWRSKTPPLPPSLPPTPTAPARSAR